jgi:curli biogenesis system outer membrane secretion channel CsgG
LILAGASAAAKTKVDVAPFINKTAAGPCNFVESWQKDIEENFKFQLSNALTESGQFSIVEAELMRSEERAKLFDSGVSTKHKKSTFKASKFSIYGALKSFDVCDKKAQVVLEIRVIENFDGSLKHKFTVAGQAKSSKIAPEVKGSSFQSGLFKDSPIGKATVEAIADATSILKKAFPDREIASGDYKIRTIPRSRAR